MFEPQEIRSEHKDVIHDVLYDYYGQRIATCSSDQTVKVWQKNIARLRQNGTDVLELRMIQLCIYFRVDLGSEWKRCMDCVGQLESAFRIRVAFIMGTSRIWNRFGNMLIRSHCFGMGGNNWWKANTNNDTS